ncbi:NAD(P)/FAD-dependent oxidoreductase [Methylacidimicrobium cyclopophantes]|nr:hypothetical protein [Methylacidimicrobium cyclopophantes]
MKPVEIVGGGLAGLALGIALRKRGIPVGILEAARYPRHKVCGEFLSGGDPGLFEALGILDLLERFPIQRSLLFASRGKVFFRSTLPRPAYGASRFLLDARLAERFQQLGGELHLGERVAAPSEKGRVVATGRPRGEARWLGIRIELAAASPRADLEMHFGKRGYAGLASTGRGRANLCALLEGSAFPRQGALSRIEFFSACLEERGLGSLAELLGRGEPLPESFVAVAGFRLGRNPCEAEEIRIGDAYAAIPPFTGNGMAMALESALLAADPLADYARGRLSWREARGSVELLLWQRLRRRMRWALALHRWILRDGVGGSLWWLLGRRLIPFDFLCGRLQGSPSEGEFG